VKTPERDVTDGNARFVASRFVTSRFVHARAPRSGGISMTIDDEWVAVVRARARVDECVTFFGRLWVSMNAGDKCVTFRVWFVACVVLCARVHGAMVSRDMYASHQLRLDDAEAKW